MLFLIICASISLALATPENNVYSPEEGHELFGNFIKEHNKQYDGNEREERFKIFLDNLRQINELNEKSSNAVFGITEFADLTKEEFIQTYTGLKPNEEILNMKYTRPEVDNSFNYTAPDAFDWRSKGVVSRVKNQGTCGSCWAFSASGNVESINAIKSGKIVEISEQQLVDCDEKSSGCGGGFPHLAIDYLVKNGAMSSQSYQYQATDGICTYDRKNVVIKLKSLEYSKIREHHIKEKLFKTGPLSIAIDADILRVYTNGIVVDGCRSPINRINHAVLLVGYGSENGVDYWIIKNSWAAKWGEQGYFRIKRGINCLNVVVYGIATAVM